MDGEHNNLLRPGWSLFDFGLCFVIFGLILFFIGIILHSSKLYYFLALIIVLVGILFMFLNKFPAKQQNIDTKLEDKNKTQCRVIVETKSAYEEECIEEKTEMPLKQSDPHKNFDGNEYDLTEDGAFKDYKIAVLNILSCQSNGELKKDFTSLEKELNIKGFELHQWADTFPSLNEFRKMLGESCQLWIISSNEEFLKEEYLNEIEAFFDEGKGVYIFGDNENYYADANRVATRLFGAYMYGYYPARMVIYKDQKENIKNGFPRGCLNSHLIMTNINCLYEGDTTSEIVDKNNLFEPILYGSAGNLTVAVYDKNGKRAVLDTGFTRIMNDDFGKTDGTARYIKNAAAFLVNLESQN